MSSVVPKFGPGPVTYEVAEAVKGGQVVEARANGKIGVAAAGSLVVLGVASRDATPTVTADGTTSTGHPVVDISVHLVSPYVAVHGEGHVPVVFSAAVGFGQSVVATANGQVGPAGATPDARTIIGTCREPGGITTAGQVGLIKISR